MLQLWPKFLALCWDLFLSLQLLWCTPTTELSISPLFRQHLKDLSWAHPAELPLNSDSYKIAVNLFFGIFLEITHCLSLYCSFSNGFIFSTTCEYLTLADTQAASGTAATDALFADAGLKESLLIDIKRSTAWRFSGLILLASNDLMSSFTPLLDKKFFMLFQEVSWMPIKRRTPSKMSRMTSGGARRERISDKDSVLIFPTAALASWMRGSTSANSSSISFFLQKYESSGGNKVWPWNPKEHLDLSENELTYLLKSWWFSSSLFTFNVSIFSLCTFAFCIVLLIMSKAAFAFFCFSASFSSCTAAFCFNSDTSCFASVNFVTPAWKRWPFLKNFLQCSYQHTLSFVCLDEIIEIFFV